MAGDPRNNKYLGNLFHEVDRIGRFSKTWISLRQLAQANEGRMAPDGKTFIPGIVPLQELLQKGDLSDQLYSKWMQTATETVHAWDSGRSAESRDAIANAFFALTDMRYLSPAEQKAGVKRPPAGWDLFLSGQPASGELLQLFKDNKLKFKDQEIIRRVANDFKAFLEEARVSIAKKLTKKFATSPQLLQQALTKLQADFSVFALKPYFPMVRFGEFTLSAKQGGPKGKTIWASAYGTEREREAALEELRKQYPQP
jgi:hypothetical protein